MKKYKVLTTSMLEIIVEANSEEEAINIARTQFKEWDEVMMVSSHFNIL